MAGSLRFFLLALWLFCLGEHMLQPSCQSAHLTAGLLLPRRFSSTGRPAFSPSAR